MGTFEGWPGVPVLDSVSFRGIDLETNVLHLPAQCVLIDARIVLGECLFPIAPESSSPSFLLHFFGYARLSSGFPGYSPSLDLLPS